MKIFGRTKAQRSATYTGMALMFGLLYIKPDLLAKAHQTIKDTIGGAS